MRKIQSLTLVATLGVSLLAAPSTHAKAKVTKPSAPTIVSITSSSPKKGLVNVTVKISLPASNGGSKITGSKITAGGKTCTIVKLKTSCTIKGISKGQRLNVVATSKNKKGFGTKSKTTKYTAGTAQLRFNLKNAAAVALSSSTRTFSNGRSAVSTSPKLLVTNSAGTISNGIVSGSAPISKFMIAPNGNLFVVFNSKSDVNGVQCLLAEVVKETGTPTCIDSSLQSIYWEDMGINYSPIQFDSAGAIYYIGATGEGKTALRMFKDGRSTDLINENVYVSSFMAIPSGGVLLSGVTSSTNTRWTRKVSPSGGISGLESSAAWGFNKYSDGNIYYGVLEGISDGGIKKYNVASDSVDSMYWISGRRNGSLPPTVNDVSPLCTGSNYFTNASFCMNFGTETKSSHSPVGGKTFITAGYGDSILIQVYPTLSAPQISIKKISIAKTLGGGIVVAGLDAGNRNKLIYFNADSGSETTLLPSNNEFEIYHMAYNASMNKLMFDGLRFSDNKYVFGQIDLGTNELNIFTTLSTKWEDFQGFQ